jgi:hypothetical protein
MIGFGVLYIALQIVALASVWKILPPVLLIAVHVVDLNGSGFFTIWIKRT